MTETKPTRHRRREPIRIRVVEIEAEGSASDMAALIGAALTGPCPHRPACGCAENECMRMEG